MLSVPAEGRSCGSGVLSSYPMQSWGMRCSDLLLLWDCLLLPAQHLCAPCQLRSGCLGLVLLFMQLKSQILAPKPPVVNPKLVRHRGTSTLLIWGTVAWGMTAVSPAAGHTWPPVLALSMEGGRGDRHCKQSL